MKAVVVELNKGLAAVLSDDGCIVTIKNSNYEIGQVIQMSNPKLLLTKKITAIAASAAAFLVLGVGGWAYASPYSYVSLDVNPSIEFTVNRFDRVIKVKAVNDDGEELLQEKTLNDLENKTIEDAMIKTVEQISEAGYFEGDVDGGIVITTSGQDIEKAEDLAEELQDTVEIELAKTDDQVVVEAISVALERVEEARALGITPGKLNLIEKLKATATDPTAVTIEDWMNRPVREIMKATKDLRKASAASGSAIIITETDDKDQTDESKDQKREEKAFEKANKDAEKALKEAEKAKEKATAEAEKAKDKAEKAKKAEKKAKDADKKNQKEATETAKIAEKEAKAAKKAADEAKEASIKAEKKAKEATIKAEEKALEEANIEKEKAKKDAEKAKEKAVKTNGNTKRETEKVDHNSSEYNDDDQDQQDNNLLGNSRKEDNSSKSNQNDNNGNSGGKGKN